MALLRIEIWRDQRGFGQFSPQHLNINAGDAFFWTNNDYQPHWPGLLHPSGEIDRTFFMPAPIANNSESILVVNEQPGTFSYACSIHPAEQGTITVYEKKDLMKSIVIENSKVGGDVVGRDVVIIAGDISRITSVEQRLSHERIDSARRATSRPRFVNLIVRNDSANKNVPKSDNLRPGSKYMLAVNIGRRLRQSAVINPIALPTEKLPPNPEGHWLEVVAVSDDFSLEQKRHHLFLPRAGASFVCNCEPHQSHTCSEFERRAFLLIPIVTPSQQHLAVKRPESRELADSKPIAYRPAKLRMAIYFQKNLVQSMILSAGVDHKHSRRKGYHARIDYSLTSYLSDLSFLKQRELNILTNHNEDTSHKLIINRELGEPISFNLTEGRMRIAIEAARQVLKDIGVHEYGGQLGTQVQYESRYDGTNAKSRDAFIADLRLLAPLGWNLWATLFQTQPEARDNLATRLKQASTRPATIQISRIEGSSLIFPWSFIYDIPLEADPRKHVLCELLKTWDGDLPDRCPFEQQHKNKNVICPFGFWGFNHVIEQVPSMPPGRNLPMLIKRAKTHAKAQLVMGISLDLNRVVTDAHKKELQKLSAFELIPKDSRDQVQVALSQDELEMIYFYCHGRREALAGSKAIIPYIQVGTKEGIAPSDITTWQMADWHKTHWCEISPLVFINGCHTAELTPDLLVDFVDSFIGVHAAGVIGTEILLLQEIASEAAEQILVMMNKKNAGEYLSVGEAIRKMRLHFLGKGNLLGLAYTPYCSADLRLAN